MELRNYTVTAVLTVFLALVSIPLSSAYDFVGAPKHRRLGEPAREEAILEEETENITEQEEYLNYSEIEYSVLQSGNIWEKLPASKSGNYVIIYRNQTCPYCDKLIAELKDNLGDYTLVVVKCPGVVKDVFYSRRISYFPSFVVITNKAVRYYGYGYRTLEEFKRLL